MLVLSRQRDETIMIGDDVEITVVDIRGDKVRLGITAPRHIQVHRKEVYEAIKRENQQAAGLRPEDVRDVVKPDAPPAQAQPLQPPAPEPDAPRPDNHVRRAR
ncbi:MAG: carbon storage regulator CsrA [Planctomycetes bacterium]|nr:carbon storage regulator CsrA [Planctomycetota bacterium]